MLAEQMRVRVNARAGNVPVPPQHMVYIPGGHFYMGPWDSGNAASSRSVYVSPFFMDRYEVWGAFYREVREWALVNGYDMKSGGYREGNHPIHSVSWYDAVKWCNARSEREGLTPVYYTNTIHATVVYRSGNVDFPNWMVKWNANGYRLPTEAEWEKAARGGLSGKLYPWGDSINYDLAVYSVFLFQVPSPTSPIGSKNQPNGYGIFDVAGNVWEWCWDAWSINQTGDQNPRGPATRSGSVLLRGGSWTDIEDALRCSFRTYVPQWVDQNNIGLRCARSL